MGTFSLWHWMIVLVVILIVFGAGKLPKVAGDLAQGIKNFKKGMQEQPESETPAATPAEARTIEGNGSAAAHDRARARDQATQG